MGIYQRLGVRPFINAAGTITTYGGSLMSPEVVEAMRQAAGSFVELEELQRQAGRHLAELIGVEGVYITSGAAAGIAIAVAATITGLDRAKAERLPDTQGMKNEVLMHRSHRNGFAQAALTAGARIVEFGGACADSQGALEELEAHPTEGTAAYLYFACSEGVPDSPPLEAVVSICRQRGVPVIVDAAAELPPRENLTRYVQRGADAVIFSGGKQIGGPQATGLIIGRSSMIEACALNGPPRHSIGRTMKVSKEEIAGLVRAVELFLALDERELMNAWDGMAQTIHGELSQRGAAGLRLRLVRLGEPGTQPQEIPRVYIDLPDTALARRSEILAALKRHEPGIIVDTQSRGLAINPQTLVSGEEIIVPRAVAEVLQSFLRGGTGSA